MSKAQTCAMAVMAKAPRLNHVKTRLVPPLTPVEAASLHAGFLRDITENIRAAGGTLPIDGYVAYAPRGAEALFHGMLADGTALVLADGSRAAPAGIAGFGCALFHAAVSLLERGYGGVCLVNSDSPTLPTAFLHHAAAALAQPGDRIVLGVADDGGYYLIGLKAPHAGLFRDIAWSTEEVSTQTLARAATLGLDVVALPPWFDVDDACSLTRLTEELGRPPGIGPVPYAAHATRAWLQQAGYAKAKQRVAVPPPLAGFGRETH